MSFLQPYSSAGDRVLVGLVPGDGRLGVRGPSLPAHRSRRPLAGKAPWRSRRPADRQGRGQPRTRELRRVGRGDHDADRAARRPADQRLGHAHRGRDDAPSRRRLGSRHPVGARCGHERVTRLGGAQYERRDGDQRLAGISPAEHPSLRARIQLSGGGGATPVVQSLKVLFNAAAQPPAPPPPPPPPLYTLATSAQKVVFGQQVMLSGSGRSRACRSRQPRRAARSALGRCRRCRRCERRHADASGAYRATATPIRTHGLQRLGRAGPRRPSPSTSRRRSPCRAAQRLARHLHGQASRRAGRSVP